MLIKLLSWLFRWGKPIEENHFMGTRQFTSKPKISIKQEESKKQVIAGDYCNTCGEHVNNCKCEK